MPLSDSCRSWRLRKAKIFTLEVIKASRRASTTRLPLMLPRSILIITTAGCKSATCSTTREPSIIQMT